MDLIASLRAGSVLQILRVGYLNTTLLSPLYIYIWCKAILVRDKFL